MEKILKQVEKKVLAVYKKVNPSTHKIESNDIFKYHQKFRESLFRDKLKFPLQMFDSAELLDFGSGTGEQDLFYAKWGANITGVEMNNLSVDRCKKLFKKYKLTEKLKIHNISLFDFKPNKKFDIVVSNGVLHHTNDQRAGFKKLVSYLRPRGFVFISVGNKAGAFQRNLQRMILYKLAKSEEEIVTLAKFLFKEHIDRAVKYGKRSADSIIYDSYVVPKADNASVEEILKWFDENNIKFYSSWPPLQFPFPLVDSPRNDIIDYTEKKYRKLLSFSEYFWMTANATDKEIINEYHKDLLPMNNLNKITDLIKDIGPDSVIKLEKFKEIENLDFNFNLERIYKKEINKISNFFKELKGLIYLLKNTKDIKKIKKEIDKNQFLFNGYCGQGDIYYMGYKE
ncbi:MAG: class I SAM-dependent methyltransferase [Candidatus Niyogibacteria bacterium]|nr:class I SAM-dependent methyltransferase [Candidatus Niyogibacteria bacterium]